MVFLRTGPSDGSSLSSCQNVSRRILFSGYCEAPKYNPMSLAFSNGYNNVSNIFKSICLDVSSNGFRVSGWFRNCRRQKKEIATNSANPCGLIRRFARTRRPQHCSVQGSSRCLLRSYSLCCGRCCWGRFWCCRAAFIGSILLLELWNKLVLLLEEKDSGPTTTAMLYLSMYVSIPKGSFVGCRWRLLSPLCQSFSGKPETVQ